MAPSLRTLGDRLYWSYANLAMAHAALDDGVSSYRPVHYMIRAKLFKALRTGSSSPRPFIDDERLKPVLSSACCYCGTAETLELDHLLPRSRGGPDGGDNLVWACGSCNRSKGAKDPIAWLAQTGVGYPPLLLLRRYLKMCIQWAVETRALDIGLAEMHQVDAPFDFEALPRKPPEPTELRLWVVDLGPGRVR